MSYSVLDWLSSHSVFRSSAFLSVNFLAPIHANQMMSGRNEADNFERESALARLVFSNSFKCSIFFQIMSDTSKKRTLDAFFKPSAKKIKTEDGVDKDGKQNPPIQDRVSPQMSQILMDNLMKRSWIIRSTRHTHFIFHVSQSKYHHSWNPCLQLPAKLSTTKHT